MTARLRVIDGPPIDETGPNPWAAAPGEMWRCSRTEHVIPGRAPCWVIRLPAGAWVWHTNEPASGTDQFWDVTGDPPNLTVHPSINVGPDIWHGFITNGEMAP